MNFLTLDALKPQASAGSVCDDFACAEVELIKLASIRKVNSSFSREKVSKNEASYLQVSKNLFSYFRLKTVHWADKSKKMYNESEKSLKKLAVRNSENE